MSLMKNAPSVSVRDNGNGRVQAAHHLGCSDEVIHSCNGEIGLAKTGSGCSGTAVTLFQYLASRESQGRRTSGTCNQNRLQEHSER